MAHQGYVHGYDPRERERLVDQASALVDLIHLDTRYPAGARVLEAGCGVGAQTVALVRHSPEAQFIAVDRNAGSIAQAFAAAKASGIANVAFGQADIFALPFGEAMFDHVFVCFVLEHVEDPLTALRTFKRLLKPGGTITVIEGDHGSACFHPDSAAARATIESLVSVQRRAGGNANIGRELFPLLARARFDDVRVSPRVVYVDGSQPALADAITRRTFVAMIEGAREQALAAGVIDAQTFDQGIRDLDAIVGRHGVFYFTFFKAVGCRPCLKGIP